MSSDRFAGKVVVLTGGASGIGRATADEFMAEGAAVAVLDRDVSAPVEEDNYSAQAVDVRDEERVAAAVSEIRARWGRIDCLVNAAGIECVADVGQLSGTDWDTVMDTNLKGCFLTAKYAMPALAETRGSIVNVASQLALVGARSFSAYTASKSGVLGFTRSLALEGASVGVRANAICPGAVDTPLLRRQFADGRDGPQGSYGDLVRLHPLGRVAEPREIARPILFLCSDDASFVTASTFVVDGGYTAW